LKIPRDVSGIELCKLLKKYDYQITRQTASHIRLTTHRNGDHHITIPKHKILKIGTINNILVDIASHLELDKFILIKELFEKK
jgi:predicted RNA binding protein YcfA (HicA-like mRNA interferase family)